MMVLRGQSYLTFELELEEVFRLTKLSFNSCFAFISISGETQEMKSLTPSTTTHSLSLTSGNNSLTEVWNLSASGLLEALDPEMD